VIEPPPQGNAFDWIWKKWMSGLWDYLKTRESYQVSVKDFGAIGDGVTDDTAAIQAALDHAESYNVDYADSAATVLLNTGRYRVSNLLLPNGVSLVGLSTYGAIIEQIPGSVGPILAMERWNNNVYFSQKPSRVSNLTFDGNASNGAVGDGVQPAIKGIMYFGIFEHIKFDDIDGEGIRLETLSKDSTAVGGNCVNTIIQNNFFSGTSGTAAITLSDSTGNDMADIYIRNNIIAASDSKGIYADRSAGCFITGNWIYDTDSYPIEVYGAGDILIGNNRIDTYCTAPTTLQASIRLTSAGFGGVNISGNTIRHNNMTGGTYTRRAAININSGVGSRAVEDICISGNVINGGLATDGSTLVADLYAIYADNNTRISGDIGCIYDITNTFHTTVYAVGYAELPRVTATNIADVSHFVNTDVRRAGQHIIDDTNNRIMFCKTSTASDPWYVADGSASVTPS